MLFLSFFPLAHFSSRHWSFFLFLHLSLFL
jgi:hypothetical protein